MPPGKGGTAQHGFDPANPPNSEKIFKVSVHTCLCCLQSSCGSAGRVALPPKIIWHCPVFAECTQQDGVSAASLLHFAWQIRKDEVGFQIFFFISPVTAHFEFMRAGRHTLRRGS